MQVFQDTAGRWIMFAYDHSWICDTDAEGKTRFTPTPEKYDAETLDNAGMTVEYYDESIDLDFPYIDDIRAFREPWHDNGWTAYTFHQADGKLVIVRNPGEIQTYTDKDTDYDDGYKLLFDDFLSDEQLEAQCRKHRRLNWKEEIELAHSCLEAWQYENGKS